MSDKTMIWNPETWNPEIRLDQPLRWIKPRLIVVSMDLFREDVTDDFIDRVFAVMALSKQHMFQLRTDHLQRMQQWLDVDHDNRMDAVGQAMREIAADHGGDDAGLPEEWPLPNVSIENELRVPAVFGTEM